MTDEPNEPRALDCLNVIEIDRRRVFESFVHSDRYLAGETPNRGGHRCHHHCVEKADDFLPGKNEDWPLLIGCGET